MVRTLLITAAAGIVLMLISFAGAAALGGPELRNYDWIINDNQFERVERQPEVERTLEWNGTDTFVLAVPADVRFVQSDTPSVRVTGPASHLDRLTLVDGRLSMRDGPDVAFGHHGDVHVEIAAPNVSRFVVEGSGELELSGIDQDALTVEITGSGDVTAYGRARQLAVTVEGSGDADLDELRVEDATVRVSGSGDASVNATGAATAAVEGSGDVAFSGRPASLTQTVDGSGDVTVYPRGDDDSED